LAVRDDGVAHNDLINAGAKSVDAPVVRDRNIITSRAPNDLPEFCRVGYNAAIIQALAE
jgi:protease I